MPIAVLLGYLLGAIPFGLVLTRLAGRGDIRDVGSGNIGATNVLRTGNRVLAALTLVGDMLKGTAAVLLGSAMGGFGLLAGAAAFFGHLFPVWLRFRGGKGVATYLGVLIGVDWRAAVAFAATWLAVVAVTRISSAGALVASLVAPLVLAVVQTVEVAAVVALLSAVLWVRHADNIRRLAAGTESRLGQSK